MIADNKRFTPELKNSELNCLPNSEFEECLYLELIGKNMEYSAEKKKKKEFKRHEIG